MITTRSLRLTGIADVPHRRKQERLTWWFGYVACAVGCVLIAFFALASATSPFSLAVLMLLMGLAVAVARPVLGLYLTAFLAILGDPVISAWYPFTKNMSSAESILYLNGQAIFSPLELFLGALVVGWVLNMLATHSWEIHRGVLFRPMVVFTSFALVGLVYGLARGGNTNAALWELRPLLYIPVVYLLVSNLLRRAKQFEWLYWCVMVAVFLNALLAYASLESLDAAQRADLESLVAHGATLPMNAMFVLVLAGWLTKGTKGAKRFVLPLMAVPVMVVYLASDRRAAFVALIGALILMGVVLFWTRRRLFWILVPPVLLVGAGYLAVFWNSTSDIGAPAQAAKSVIAPDSVSKKDLSSDLYRQVENADITATIRSNPLLGVGFGREFLKPFPLPFISPFLLANYITHNSIMWIWMKAGIGGFLAMLYLFAKTMRTGARAILRTAGTSMGAITLTSVAFVLVYLIFAYVDIAWDAQNVVLLAIAIAQIDAVGRLADDPPDASVEAHDGGVDADADDALPERRELALR